MIDYRQVMKFEKKNVEKFLEDFDINYERDVDYTLVALVGDIIIGCGSCAGCFLLWFVFVIDF